MDEGINNNFAEVAGVIVHSPAFSHENRGEKFYTPPSASADYRVQQTR